MITYWRKKSICGKMKLKILLLIMFLYMNIINIHGLILNMYKTGKWRVRGVKYSEKFLESRFEQVMTACLSSIIQISGMYICDTHDRGRIYKY